MRATVMPRPEPEALSSQRIWRPASVRSDVAGDNTSTGYPSAVPTRVGRVTLVGAGPGDVGCLTQRAIAALGDADVILFDSLVSEDVLAFAHQRARRILVGKRAGRPSCQQQEINALMVRLARAGHQVLRLKAGDPMVFGRAGEEIDCLERRGGSPRRW